MSNCISELSSHSLQAWLGELSQQVKTLGVLLDASEEQQKQQGYYHTLHEICQQPLTWIDTAARVRANRNRLKAVLTESGIQDKRGDIILTGSGSSLFVGECLDLVLQRALEVPVHAVAAGRILTHPALALPPGRDCLVVSFARSGDSPESRASIDLLRELGRRQRHLIVTCNKNGKLAVKHRSDPETLVLVLDDATCDRSLVMTSSFTNMVWAARSLGVLDSLDSYDETTERLAQLGKETLLRHSGPLSLAGQSSFRSAVFLGSGVRLGAARESALKMLEMTGGQVTTLAETYLGVRHGPLSAILPDTLIVCFLSGDPTVRAYELDLLCELNQKKLGMTKIVFGESVPADAVTPGDLVLECPGLGRLGDENAPVLDVMVGQLLAFFRCLDLGLKPDFPSSQGIISRVVGEFPIHRKG